MYVRSLVLPRYRYLNTIYKLLPLRFNTTDIEIAEIDTTNDVCRVLSDFRGPHHDLESALSPFSSKVSTNLVEQVLKRCKNLGFPAHRFFIWARSINGFIHSGLSYRILFRVLGNCKQFPLVWDLLWEMKDERSSEINSKLFYSIFCSYCEANLPAEAIRSFSLMEDFGVKPCITDFNTALRFLCEGRHMDQAQKMFENMKAVFEPTAKTYGILIDGWGDLGRSEEARKMFDEMIQHGFSADTADFNSLMNSLCRDGKVKEAYSLFSEMRSTGLEPNSWSYSIFIHAACRANDVGLAFKILDKMRGYKIIPNLYTYNFIVKTLCRGNRVVEAYDLLNEMTEKGVNPDIWSYNAVLGCHCVKFEVNQALMLVDKMVQNNCFPDRSTYNVLLKMLIRVGRYDKVIIVWDGMKTRGFSPSVSTYSVMIHGFCNNKDKLDEACHFFEMMIDDGITPYATTIEFLRIRLVRMGFLHRIGILAKKMTRSSSCPLRDMAMLMTSGCGDPRRTSIGKKSKSRTARKKRKYRPGK